MHQHSFFFVSICQTFYVCQDVFKVLQQVIESVAKKNLMYHWFENCNYNINKRKNLFLNIDLTKNTK